MSLIEVKGLCKSFDGLSVLHDVNLTVEQGERIAIIGGSGCGKSVFLRSLERLHPIDAGQIFIDGQEITAKGADVDKIRRSMGMVYQKFHLFSEMDVMDNLCLMMEPKVLLFDEPTSALAMPDCTAKYLTSVNDQVRQSILYHPEKAEGFSQSLLNILCNGYSFMMLEENSDLRDQFDQVTDEMRSDGTLDELIKIHITDVIESGEPEAVVFEEFEGDPIRIAITGSLPPMDYVAEDGTPAGFNTAVLAEIGKRLGKNIELVQVDSMGRALALAQGNVDAVFWTRSTAGGMLESGLPEMSPEEFAAYLEEVEASRTDEENAIVQSMRDATTREERITLDMPEGTVVTDPYYTDMTVVVVLK